MENVTSPLEVNRWHVSLQAPGVQALRGQGNPVTRNFVGDPGSEKPEILVR